MLRSLKEVQSDDSIVGFYQSTTLGAFFSQSLVETLATQREKLRRGGVVIVHGKYNVFSFHLIRRAAWLTRQDRYISDSTGECSISGLSFDVNFSGSPQGRKVQYTEVCPPPCCMPWLLKRCCTFSLIDRRLTFSSILEEIPVVIRTSALLNALIATVSEPSSDPSVNPSDFPVPTLAVPQSSLPPSFALLNLESPNYLTSNLERIVEGLDDYKNEENNLGYLSRQIAREKARADTYVQKRREENASRIAAGLAPLPEDDVARLFKIPPEPSRLESMLLLGQVESYAKTLESLASSQLVKTYATRI